MGAKDLFGHGTAAFIAVSALALLPAAANAAGVGPGWKIAAPRHADAAVQRVLEVAAQEVQADIEDATGLKLPIVPASEAGDSGVFWFGREAAEKAGFRLADFSGWDNAYAEKGGSIYFYGLDHPGRGGLTTQDGDLRYTVYPSARAAARFLRDRCGVKFVMPGRVGTEVPKVAEISLEAGAVGFERPTQRFGSYSTHPESLMYAVANSFYPSGDLFSYGGHTYPSACPRDKYFKDHPEYFGMKNGKRHWGDGPTFQALCISNPEVEDLIVAEVERRLDAGASICQLAQQDGLDHCECDKCRALYGTGDDWGEKYWCFHKHIAERILKERPGKTVHILSYSMTRHPPKTFREFPENVMIELCKNSESDFAEWCDYTVPRGFSVYIYHWMAYSIVGFTPRRSLYECHASARRYVTHGSVGIYRCGDNLGLCALEGPQYYVFNKTLENPDASIDAELAEFCNAAFGQEAAGPMISFYETLDYRLRGFDRMVASVPDVPGVNYARNVTAQPDKPLDILAYIYTPDVLGAMEGALAFAEKSKTATARQRKRLERVRAEFDYAKNLGWIATHYAAYKARPSKDGFLPLAAALRERRAMLDRLFAGGNTVRLDGWPTDALLLGRDASRGMVEVNGRSGAVTRNPLDWDVDRMLKEGAFPWTAEDAANRRAYNAAKGLECARNWKTYGSCPVEISETSRDGARLRFGSVTNGNASAVARISPKGGLKPNTRYRVSWFVRADYIAPVWGTRYGQERGLFFMIESGSSRGVQTPWLAAFRGGFDWRHMSLDVTTSEKPGSDVAVKAEICNANGIVEVEDLTVEELSE